MNINNIIAILASFLLFIQCTEKEESSEKSSSASVVKSKKIFHYARSAEPRSLDPAIQFDQISSIFTSSIYDTLLEYHYLKRPYELIPSLLQDFPKVSADGTLYEFQLRQGIFFHDDPCFQQGKGREVTADDVIFSLKRFSDAKINVRSWFLLDNTIEGLDEFRKKTSSKTFTVAEIIKEKIAGLKKIDRFHFSVKLKKKNPLFLYSIASSSAGIVPHEAITKYGSEFGRHPVGTGPFKLEKYLKKQTMVLVKNDKYHGIYPQLGGNEPALLLDKGKRLPFLDEVHVHYIPESQPQMLKFKKGGLSWIGLDRDNFIKMAYKNPDGSFSLKKEEAKKYDIYSESALSAAYYYFNLKDPLFKDNWNLRAALVHSLDINAKIELLRNGRGTKLYSVVPIGIQGSEEQIGKKWYDYDLKKAKEYLTKAGYPGGKGLPELELTLAASSSQYKKDYEFLRNSFAKIGVILKADYKTWSTHTKALERGDFHIATWGWAADYPDAENFLQLFYGGNIPGSNLSYFANKEFDTLYEEIRYMSHGAQRTAKIAKMGEIVKSQIPAIIDYTPVMSGLIQKNVKNFKRNIMITHPFKYLDIRD